MNWKTEATERLRNMDTMRQSLVSIPEEIKRLESAARSVRGATTDKTPVQGGGSRREDAWLNNIVQRQMLAHNLRQAESWIRSTQGALSVLSPQERLILLRLYICPEPKALERLVGELGIEQSSIYRHRDRALKKFTMALYGITES
jgi:hypothetical protein